MNLSSARIVYLILLIRTNKNINICAEFFYSLNSAVTPIIDIIIQTIIPILLIIIIVIQPQFITRNKLPVPQ